MDFDVTNNNAVAAAVDAGTSTNAGVKKKPVTKRGWKEALQVEVCLSI